MDEFKSLVKTIERLLAPDGCPWDREQTLQSMRHSLVEETYEVIEAIDLNDKQLLEEELGDLLFNVIFLCKLAEKDFSLTDVLKKIIGKLVRRHPHIFGEAKLISSEEVVKQWENIKTKEKKERDEIPRDLPSLARAQKLAKRFNHRGFVAEPKRDALTPEEQAGETLWLIAQQMFKQGIHAEEALRKRLTELEVDFRDRELE